ncbi:MAG: P-loop NTPase fold protein [Dolichospermum sp.]
MSESGFPGFEDLQDDDFMNNNLDMFAKSTNPVNSGVNRKEAESIIEKFLKNDNYDNYRVLAVKGKWGVGKTHLVRTVLDKHQKNDYLYASVFGISSIEHLKARIFANYQKNIKPKPINNIFEFLIEFLNRNSGRLEKTPKLDFGLSGSLLTIGGDLLLEIFFNLNVNGNSIICIDDLERKSQLPLKDIFGFVEYLVQDFKCKIILIYNEDNLDEDSQTALETYREKVIDKEFNLNPTVEENLDFIFKDSFDIDVIKEVFKKAGTNNIRVIRKTKWLIDEFIPLMKDWEESLRHQIIRNIIVINLEKLDTEFRNKFPSIKDIISTLSKDPSEYMGSDQKANDIQIFNLVQEQNKAIGRIQLFFQKLFIPLEELDEIIIQVVDTSLSQSTELEFIKKGDILNKREIKNKTLQKLDELSNHLYRFKYQNSFADNEQEIANGILGFMEENHLQLSLSQLRNIETFASMLGLDIDIYEKSLLEQILKETSELDDLFELRNTVTYPYLGQRNLLIKYPDLAASLNEKINEYYQTLDINITTALQNIINDDSYSKSSGIQEYIEFLKSRSVNEYCEWLTEGHPELPKMVKWLLKPGYEPASQNLEKAICILAKKSELNKIRAKYLYNIDIDNQPHPENP